MNIVIESEQYIYESPDQGNTVYRRKIGDPYMARELIIEKEPNLFSYAEFTDLLKRSETNVSLKKALDHLVLIYYTIKDDKDPS
jgi:hypothetical protein